MITVKHVIDPLNETVYAGTHVRWHQQGAVGDPQSTELEIVDRDAVVATLRHSGSAYVMNAQGKTVAHYLLPPFQPDNRGRIVDAPGLSGVMFGAA